MKQYLAALFLFLSFNLQASIREQSVAYSDGTTVLKAYLVWDDALQSKRPAVLVVHEWWGLNDYARKRARMLAELGYTAMAVDMYGNGKHTEHPKEAQAFMQAVMGQAGLAQKRFNAALEIIKKHPSVDARKVAAIGYCFGGATVLNMARAGLDLVAVASFHGILTAQTTAQKGAVKARIIAFNGAYDGFVTAESIDAFKNEMTQADANFQFVNYPGAKHGFTNPDADSIGKANDMPLAYNPAADEQSWSAMQTLLKESFQGKP